MLCQLPAALRVLQRSLWPAFVALRVHQLDIWRLLELGVWPMPHDCYLLLQEVLKAFGWLVVIAIAITDSDSSVLVGSIEVVHHIAVEVALVLHCSLDYLPWQLPFQVKLHF